MTQFKFLNNPQKIRKLLFIINIFVGLVACYLGIINEFPDADHYIKLGNNLSEGYFTSWHEFQGIYSETLRTPGYPIFLFLLSFISDSPWLVYFVQFVAYVLTVLIAEKIVLSLFKKLRYVNCFYFLLIFNIQVPYYSGLVSAECLTILSVVTYLYILVRKKELTIKDWMWAAIVASVAFQMRPAFLLFPFCTTLYFFFFKGKKPAALLHSVFFIFMLLPFGFWNYNTHGTFKLTPIEGGAGVAHMGFWSFKLPDGYREGFYWNNSVVSDFTSPFEKNNEQTEQAVLAYEAEWKDINNRLKLYESQEDSVNLAYMKKTNPFFFPLHSSSYTKHRERFLWEKTKEHIFDDPVFYFKTRLYTFFRLHFTGLNMTKLKKSKSVFKKVQILYPFIASFTFILLGLFCSIAYFLVKKKLTVDFIFVFCLILYFGAIHTPFAIQARYVVPVHLFVLMMLSYTLSSLFTKKDSINSN